MPMHQKLGFRTRRAMPIQLLYTALFVPFTLQMATSAEFGLLFVLGFIALGLRICVTYDFRFVS